MTIRTVGYEIAVLDTLGVVQTVFIPSQLAELKFSLTLNDVGVFAIIFRGAEQVTAMHLLFQTDTFVEVYRDGGTEVTPTYIKENTYLTRIKDRYIDNEGVDTLIVGGPDLNDFLRRRVIDPTDDSVQPNGGYATKAGAADTVLRAYIREQAADLASLGRPFPGLTVPAVLGTAPNVGKRVRYKNLLKICQEISESVEAIQTCTDFQIQRTTALNFEAIIGDTGADRTFASNRTLGKYVVFDPNRGNLQNPRFVIDERTELNFFYVMGPGQGSDRFILQVPNNARIFASPFNRIEHPLDIRNAQIGSLSDLLTEARKAQYERGVLRQLSSDISAKLGGAIYRVDWVLGDRITIQWESIQESVRINSLVFTVNDQGETLVVKTRKLFF